MSNYLYQSILSRLSGIAPLFGKTILDQAISRIGKTEETVAAIELLEILRTEINPKMSPIGFKTNALIQAGSGFIIYDNHDEIIYLSPMIKKVIRDNKMDEKNLFSELAKVSFIRPLKEVNELLVFEIEFKQRVERTFNVSIVPIYDHEMRITGATSFIQNITLRRAIEDEIIDQSKLLREEILIRKKAQTDLELNQEQMIQASRLASLGEMAGGIAHEINNPLAVVLGGIELIELQSKKEVIDQAKLKLGVERIKAASLRIKNIVEAMRTLVSGEGQQSIMTLCSIENLLADVLAICHEKFISAGIELVVESKLDGLEIPCLPVELGQVFINLLNNAFDVVSELKEKFVTIKLTTKDNHILMSFIDSGQGIPLEIEKKMFDPFFTTKPVGKGVGIGMSISRKIIDIHKGKILIDRKSPNTKIDIILPLKQE